MVIIKPLMAILGIVVTSMTTWVKQSVMLVVNIIMMIVMICLVASDHLVIVVDSLIHGN